MSNPIVGGAFTLKSKPGNQVRQLTSEVVVCDASDDPRQNGLKLNAIWDTGATGTVLSHRVVNNLGLTPIRKRRSVSLDNVRIANVYLINILLPNKIGIKGLDVIDGDIFGDIDVLIGMDLICLGDFAITNVNNITWFTFEIPSRQQLDFVKERKDLRKRLRRKYPKYKNNNR